jgi:dTDP-glucose 4,6-dehydratase
MINNALKGKPLPIYGDGKNVRDWLYVEDHCEAIWRVIKHGSAGETYNIGGGNQPTNLELVSSICRILDKIVPGSPYKPYETLIRFVQDRPGHDRRYAMDITKIGRELGWEPKEWLESGLQRTVKWYLDHPDWVEKVLSKGDYQQWVEQNYKNRGAAP